MTSTPAFDTAFLDDALKNVFAEWVGLLELRLISATPGEVVLALPVTPRHVHAGNVMCGQTLMAAADTAMVLAVMSKLGAFRPMTTVQLQTTFLRPVAADAGEAVPVCSPRTRPRATRCSDPWPTPWPHSTTAARSTSRRSVSCSRATA